MLLSGRPDLSGEIEELAGPDGGFIGRRRSLTETGEGNMLSIEMMEKWRVGTSEAVAICSPKGIKQPR